MTEPPVTWVVEPEAFSTGYQAFVLAVERGGHDVVRWQDSFWGSASWPRLDGQTVVFHGSLGNADRVRRELSWTPGSFCLTDGLRCSSWYPTADRWLIHREWRVLPARELVASVDAVLDSVHAKESVFVRPGSPLKPFSGLAGSYGSYGSWGALVNEYDPGTQKWDALMSLTRQAGDANLDGIVDALDCAVLQQYFGKAGTWWWMQGDFNDDGTVDGADLTAMNANITGPQCTQ